MSQRTIDKARHLEDVARAMQHSGAYRDAEAPLLTAIGLWKLVQGPTGLDTLNTEIALAASYRRRGDFHLAIPILERVAAETAKSFADPESAHVYRLALNNLCAAHRDAGDLEKARAGLEFCLTAIDLAIEPPEDLAIERARVLDNLGTMETEAGDHDACERHAAASLAVWLELRGPDDVDTLVATANLASARMRLGRLDEAAQMLLDVKRRFVEVLGPEHPRVAGVWHALGELAIRRGDCDEAQRSLELALELRRACGFGALHPDVLRTRSLLDLVDASAAS